MQQLEAVLREAARAYLKAWDDYFRGAINEETLRVIRDTYRQVHHAHKLISNQYEPHPDFRNVRVLKDRKRKDPERAHRF